MAPDDEARPVEQVGPVAAQLVEQDPLLLLGRALVDRREVEQQDEDPRPLDVAEELVARDPRPSAAPSISPGMSATTNSWSRKRTTPRLGSSVVKG